MKDESKMEILRILENYDFSIQDYIKDGGLAVISRAVFECASSIGKNRINVDEQNYIAGRIEKMFLSKLAERTLWFSDLASGKVICNIDGLRVSGEVLYSPKRVTVTIGAGKDCLSRSSILVAESAEIYTQEPFDGSPANKQGVECAKYMVMNLYPQISRITYSI